MRVARRRTVIAVVIVAAMAATLVACDRFYNHSRMDALRPVDAIVVLGGDHDGREEYALGLARDGLADTVVLFDPYGSTDLVLPRLCASATDIRVLCPVPEPSTTHGEALTTGRLVEANGWRSIMVISWRFHLPRARLHFEQCVDAELVMREVPREYHFGPWGWLRVYTHQSLGLVKAAVQLRC